MAYKLCSGLKQLMAVARDSKTEGALMLKFFANNANGISYSGAESKNVSDDHSMSGYVRVCCIVLCFVSGTFNELL